MTHMEALEAATRECARITDPKITDEEFARHKADNTPEYRNTMRDMERTIGAYLAALSTIAPADNGLVEAVNEITRPLDDINVSVDGFCKWSEVANARSEIRCRLQSDRTAQAAEIERMTYERDVWKSKSVMHSKQAIEARAGLARARHHTSNLLARIHRDGGHYEMEHGTSKAVEDADAIVASVYADEARLSALEALLDKAVEDIAAERRRQIVVEGWTPEHDDSHKSGELAIAAACYALNATDDADGPEIRFVGAELWPWSDEWWKPSDDRRNLVKAGALIAAEIDRLDRQEARHAGN